LRFMRLTVRAAAAALPVCACLLLAPAGRAQESLSVQASFAPDRLGVSTNLSLAADFASGTGRAPSPVTKFTLLAPAGIGVDTHGVGTCAPAALERRGPDACPPDSRAGFGGGVGVLELPSETIRVPYTLDFFFAAKQSGELRLLVYVDAAAPAGVELVLVARQIAAPKPYGFGITVEVPPVSTFPGLPNASIESVFVTVGSPDVAYYEPVHGHERLVRVRGVSVPRSCPSGGFPVQGMASFADGATLTTDPTIPCPGG
jgi:hypothetical protein